MDKLKTSCKIQGAWLEDFKEGPAVTENIREHYAATGVFDESSSQIVRKVFDLRTACDYDDSFAGGNRTLHREANEILTAKLHIGQFAVFMV